MIGFLTDVDCRRIGIYNICSVLHVAFSQCLRYTQLELKVSEASRSGCVVRVLALPSGGSRFEPRS